MKLPEYLHSQLSESTRLLISKLIRYTIPM